MAQIDLGDHTPSEIKRFVVDGMLIPDWKDAVIKKYIINVGTVCEQTHNDIYKGFEKSVMVHFDSSFNSDLCRVTQNWIDSNDSLERVADKYGQDAYTREFAKEAMFQLREAIREIKFSPDSVSVPTTGGSRFTDAQTVDELKALTVAFCCEFRDKIDFEIRRCEAEIPRNALYESIKALFLRYKEYIIAFIDSLTIVDELNKYLDEQRKNASSSTGSSIEKGKATKIKLKLNLKNPGNNG